MDRSRARRLYALLLRFYPRGYRVRHGRDMTDTFLADLEGRGPVAGLRLWAGAVVDAVRFGLAERVDARLGARGRRHRLGWSADVRLALRGMARRPGPALAGTTALALGVGLTATALSIVYGTLLRPLPFAEADELVVLAAGDRADPRRTGPLTHGEVRRIRMALRTVDDVGAWTRAVVSLSGPDAPPEFVGAALIEPRVFSMLRVNPVRGRLLAEADGGPEGPRAVLLGHELWQGRYGGDPEIVGRTIRVNVRRFSAGWAGVHTVEVVGVLPAGFAFPVTQQLWLPLGPDPAAALAGDGTTADVLARLADGRTLDDLRADLASADEMLRSERAAPDDRVLAAAAFRDPFTTDGLRRILLLILAGGLGVLLIACANVANLLLMRASAREGELAVRHALGAGRWTLVRQILAEALVLAVGAGVVGLGLGWVGVDLFDRSWNRFASSAFWWDLRLDMVPALATVAVVGLAAVLAGALPAWRASSAVVGVARRARGGTAARIGGALVVAEVALTTALLVPTGLTVRSVVQLTGAYRTVDAEVYTARVGLWQQDYPDAGARHAFWTRLGDRLEALPDVQTLAFTSALPLDRTGVAPVWPESEPADAPGRPVNALQVGGAYPDVLGVGMIAGRGFGPGDVAGAPPVALVNASFVDRVLGGVSPLGRRVRIGRADAEPVTIVGVIPDLWADGAEDERPEAIVRPVAQSDPLYLNVLVRPRGGDALALAGAVSAVLADLDPHLPSFQAGTVSSFMRTTTWRHRVYAGFFGFFGVTALFLSLLGLYAVMGFAVDRQTRDIGVRLALGAEGGRVVRRVVGRGLAWLVGGLVLGLPVSLWLSRGLGQILFEVAPSDPWVSGVVVLTLLGAGLLAAWLPARRAARIDPRAALAAE